MSLYFLSGSMACDGVLHVVLQHDVGSIPARVLGYMPVSNHEPLTGFRATEGAVTQGCLIEPMTREAGARLAFLFDVLGAQITPAPCRVGEEDLTALLPVIDAQGAQAEDVNSAAMNRIATSAVSEIMGYFARRSPQTIAQRLPMILARAAAREGARTGKPADFRSATAHDRIEVKSTDTSHEGFFLTQTHRLTHPRFDGTTSAELAREVFVATDAAIVLPYDPVRDRVLLVEQFRMGPFGRGDPYPWVLEPVAGRIDAGESPEACAIRECAEETGLTLHGLEKISSHYCSPGCSTEYFHIFLGLTDLPEDAAGLGGLESEQEDIRTHILSFDQAMGLLQTGEADNGPLVLSLLWLSRERNRLRHPA